MYEVKIMMIKI